MKIKRYDIMSNSNDSWFVENEKGGYIKYTDYIKLESEKAELIEVLGIDNPWPLKDVLLKLIWSTELLLNHYSYDGHSHEEMNLCVKRGKEILEKLRTQS